MNWLTFFKLFFRNLILLIVLAALVLGIFGYLLAGREGFINMAIWGIVLGLIGGVSSGLGMIFQAKYWGEGNYRIFPEWVWFIKQPGNEDKQKDH